MNMIDKWNMFCYYYIMIKLIYNYIVWFKFIKRLDIDNIRLRLFWMNIL